MFDHVQYRNRWLADPTNPANNDAARYGVEVKRTTTIPVWRVLGVHHLTPSENQGKHNIYIDVLDKDNKRYPPSNGIGVGWTWVGRYDNQPALVKPLDKPNNEPNGNVDIYRGMNLSVWISHTLMSDLVTGLTSDLPDELGPNGEIWNSVGHHSFYVTFKLYQDQLPPVKPPVDPPTNTEEVKRLQQALQEHKNAWLLIRGIADSNILHIDKILGAA